MRTILIFILAAIGIVRLNSQEYKSPGVIPPAPQTQLFENYYQKYCTQQISPTGTESINIGLYELTLSGVTIPISLTYNTSGIKYRQEDGDVGVGWTLIPGARVSRTMLGEPDETMNRVSNVIAEAEKRLDPEEKDRYLSSFIRTTASEMYPHGQSDKGCDMFSFTTINENGHFVFSDPNDITKIEILERMNCKIKPTIENKVLKSFQIIDEKGIIYNYGGNEQANLFETAYRTEYPGGVTTAWALQNIITPNNDTIYFRYIKYTENSLIEAENRSMTVTDGFDMNYTGSAHVSDWCTPYSLTSNLQQDATVPQYSTFLLSAIETKKERIQFERINDTHNQQIRILSAIRVIDKASGNIIKNVRMAYSGLPHNPHYFLESVSIGDQIYQLRYYNENDFNRPAFNIQQYSSDLWGYYLFLSSYADKINKPVLHNQFGNDNFIFGDDILSPTQPDIRKLSVITDNFKNSTQNNEAHLFSLKRITFPTGGYREYQYEPNEFITSQSRTLGGGIRLQRVTTSDLNNGISIRNYSYGLNEDRLGTPSFDLSYQAYADEYTNYKQLFHYPFDCPPNCLYQNDPTDPSVSCGGYWEYNVSFLSRIYSPNPLGDVNVNQNFIVEYPQISVYDQGSIGLIRTDYLFDIQQSLHVFPMQNSSQYSNYCAPIYIGDYKNGYKTNLTAIKYYNLTNTLIRLEEYIYGEAAGGKTIEGGIKIAQKVFPDYCGVPDFNAFMQSQRGTTGYIYMNFPSLFAYMPYAIESGTKLLKTKTITENTQNGTIVKEEKYTYNDRNQLVETTNSSSVGSTGVITKKIKYPQDYPSNSIFTAMADKNMLNTPIETTLLRGNNVVGSNLTIYKSVLNNTGVMFLPDKFYSLEITSPLTSFISFDGTTKDSHYGNPTMEFVNYDTKGNIQEIKDHTGLSTVYLWSYNYQYPVAKIEGITYSDLVTNYYSQNAIDQLAQTGVPNKSAIDAIRNSLSTANVQITTLTYAPLIGMVTATDPKGVTTNYTYDTFNRLLNIKNDDGKVLNEYRYHYYNQ